MRKIKIMGSAIVVIAASIVNVVRVSQYNDVNIDPVFTLAYAQGGFPEDPEHGDAWYGDPDCDGECSRYTYKSTDYYGRGDGGYGSYDKWCSTSTSGSGGTSGGSVGSEGYYVDGCGWSEYNSPNGSCWDESC